MVRKKVAAIAFMASLAATPVAAQLQCITNETAEQWLAQNQMTMAARGMAGPVEMLVYADPITRRFAIIARPEPGISCMVANGVGFEQAAWGRDT